MKNGPAKTVQRLQFELSDKKAAEIKQLMADCDITTQKELFSSALLLFKWAVNEISNKRIIASVDEENMRYKQIEMPAFHSINEKIEQEHRREQEKEKQFTSPILGGLSR